MTRNNSISKVLQTWGQIIEVLKKWKAITAEEQVWVGGRMEQGNTVFH